MISNRIIPLFACLLIAGLWLGALPTGFHGDDHLLVDRLQPLISGLQRAWMGEVLGDQPDYFYRPVTFSLFAFFSSFESPELFRFFALCLHVVNCLMVYALARFFGASLSSAFLACVFLGFHHVAIFTGYWISSFSDILLTTLCGFSFYRFVHQKYLTSILCFILALFTKETALVFPLILWLFAFMRKIHEREKKPLYFFALCAGVSLLWRKVAIGSFLAGASNEIYFSSDNRLYRSVGHYLYDLLIPVPYPHISSYGSSLFIALCVCGWGLFFALSIRKQLLSRIEIGALVLVMIPLLPVLHRYGKWYLYASVFIFSILLSRLSQARFQKAFFAICIGIHALSLNYYSECFSEADRLQFHYIRQSHDQTGVIQIGDWPRAVCGDVPLFTWHPQAEAAYRRIYEEDRKFR